MDLLLNLAGEIPLAVVIIPDEFQVEDWLWSTMKDGWQVGDNLDRDQPQRILTNFLGSAGVPTLDLLPIFRNHPEMEDGKRHLYHLFDTHLNARGNEVAGQALAEFLAELLE